MKILAIEASSLVASVAIMTDDIITAEYTMNHKITHSQTIMPMIDEIVKRCEADLSELDAIGAEEYFYGDGISFVEWPERADGYFPSSAIKVEIKKINDNERLIRIEDND